VLPFVAANMHGCARQTTGLEKNQPKTKLFHPVTEVTAGHGAGAYLFIRGQRRSRPAREEDQ
jgi:hypothetical protein